MIDLATVALGWPRVDDSNRRKPPPELLDCCCGWRRFATSARGQPRPIIFVALGQSGQGFVCDPACQRFVAVAGQSNKLLDRIGPVTELLFRLSSLVAYNQLFHTRRQAATRDDYLMASLDGFPDVVAGLNDRSSWFVRRSDIIEILSDHRFNDAPRACLIRDLAKLVAEYMPHILVVVEMTVCCDGAETNSSRSQAYALVVGDLGRSVSSVYDAIQIVGGAAETTYRNRVVVDYECRHVFFCSDLSRIVALDLGRWKWHPAGLSSASQSSSKSLTPPSPRCTFTAIGNSLWMIGNDPLVPKGSACNCTITPAWRYDLESRTWDPAPISIEGISTLNYHACVAVSKTHILMVGGELSGVPTSNELSGLQASKHCHLLREVEMHGRRYLTRDERSIPDFSTGPRKMPSLAALPNACAVIVAEGFREGYWTLSTECLSLKRLKDGGVSKRQTLPWAWLPHFDLPQSLNNAGQALFGSGDTLIAGMCAGNSQIWQRLRVCGDCAAGVCPKSLDEHDAAFQDWQPFFKFPHYESVFLFDPDPSYCF
jgi:hypothetical protein